MDDDYLAKEFKDRVREFFERVRVEIAMERWRTKEPDYEDDNEIKDSNF